MLRVQALKVKLILQPIRLLLLSSVLCSMLRISWRSVRIMLCLTWLLLISITLCRRS
nr:MAG TPA: hypothetical protein [Microviridae sp.]